MRIKSRVFVVQTVWDIFIIGDNFEVDDVRRCDQFIVIKLLFGFRNVC